MLAASGSSPPRGEQKEEKEKDVIARLGSALLSWPSNPAKLRQSVHPARLFPSRYAKRVRARSTKELSPSLSARAPDLDVRSMRVLHPFISLSFFHFQAICSLSLSLSLFLSSLPAISLTAAYRRRDKYARLSLSLSHDIPGGRERSTEQHRAPEPVVEWLTLAARAPPYISARPGHVVRHPPTVLRAAAPLRACASIAPEARRIAAAAQDVRGQRGAA